MPPCWPLTSAAVAPHAPALSLRLTRPSPLHASGLGASSLSPACWSRGGDSKQATAARRADEREIEIPLFHKFPTPRSTAQRNGRAALSTSRFVSSRIYLPGDDGVLYAVTQAVAPESTQAQPQTKAPFVRGTTSPSRITKAYVHYYGTARDSRPPRCWPPDVCPRRATAYPLPDVMAPSLVLAVAGLACTAFVLRALRWLLCAAPALGAPSHPSPTPKCPRQAVRPSHSLGSLTNPTGLGRDPKTDIV